MNELTTMLIGAVVRKAHQADRATYERVRNLNRVADRVAHVHGCPACQAMLAATSPRVRKLLRTLKAPGRFRQAWKKYFR